MTNEYVIPYVDEEKPLLCDAHFEFQGDDGASIVGLRVFEKTQAGPRAKGFICLQCIARMWNTPPGVPIEPSAEERESGTPILNQKLDGES